jgi:hypothetical protein
MLVSWEDIVSKMVDSDKVYNTLLKTRYALENNLIGISKKDILTFQQPL